MCNTFPFFVPQYEKLITDYTSKDWHVNINKVRTDYPIIQNLSQWLIGSVPQLNPEHPEYAKFWSKETKKCIEGVWGQEFGKWRYMPGNLYFFGNYGILEHTFEIGGVKVTENIKPLIVDYLWEMAYQSWISYGFSGFDKDILISCNDKLKLFYENKLSIDKLPSSCLYEGVPKKYESPYEYISKLHSHNSGKSLFENYTQNTLTGGSRGGTKSYFEAVGELEYNFVFGGARRYDIKFINKETRSSQCIGSAETAKSSELLSKFKFSQDCKSNGDNKNFKDWFGIWVETDHNGKQIVTPCPFYKRTLGSLACPNKDNQYRSNYKIEINGEWKEKGEGSTIAHVNYSEKKGNGARAAEGGRYLRSTVEEVGSCPNYVDILGANEGTISRAGHRFGVQHSMGTSGNIEYVQALKRVMLNPQDYNVLSFHNIFSQQGKDRRIAYFIPFYITLLHHKDKNGNTNYESALEEVNRQRIELAKSSDPRVLQDFLMNKPCYLDEMWITSRGHYLPVEEATVREKELMQDQHYKDLMNPVELIWDTKATSGVTYKVLGMAAPIVEYPLPKDLKDPSGTVVLYEFPQEVNGKIPPDMYCFVGHDPYTEEAIDRGGSLGVTYILKNPKYIPFGYTGNIIVASYIGKPIKGLDFYYEQQEKLLALYGNPQQGLWYEKNRGDIVRAWYTGKDKLHLLAPTPQYQQGSSMFQKHIQSFGYLVSSNKRSLIKMVNDWLLQETEFVENGTVTKKMNIFRLPCLFLIRQIIQYNEEPNSNFDACFAKDTRIDTIDGYKNIQDVIEGDLVLTQSGEYESVVLTHKNENSIVKLYVQGDANPILTTENHPFWVASNSKKTHCFRKDLDIKAFKAVKDIVPNKNFVLIPKRKLNHNILTNEELYLIGWYMGDGYCNKKTNAIRFRLSLREYDLGVKIKEILESLDPVANVKLRQDKIYNCYNVECFSLKIKTFLNDYGGIAGEKKLHKDIFMSSNTFYFLLGFLEAEGSWDKHKGNISISNTNIELMYQIRQMLIDNRIYNTISNVQLREGSKQQVCIDIPFTHTGQLKISSKFNKECEYKRTWLKHNAVEKEEGFYVKVLKIENTENTETVYNLSVLNDNTYVANGILVHNCMAFVGCILGLREYESMQKQELLTKPQTNRFQGLLSNPKIFNQDKFKTRRQTNLQYN